MSDVESQLRESLAGRYRVGRELGRGGMAVVYQAEDIRHMRPVAIKVLRPEFAAALGADRFLREIETSARLRHPHILPLFDSGQAGTLLFYVMPLVEGKSLRARLDRERQLPLDDALRIAREVADALHYAHARGIVHRDIKPENVLLESGHAVVADFGIARVVSAAADRPLTQVGFSLGTPQYMSPEQMVSDQDVDGRADLYSLACTLYEMLAGQPPFTASSMERLRFEHFMATPPRVTQFRPSVPAAVASALQRALAKSPADRFPSSAAFAEALSQPATPQDETPSVAVLPFQNLSADPENEYFADGITEDVIAQLAKIRALKVVARASVMPFKKREQGLSEIAGQLQVAALLVGSVRRAGSRVRIVAQLIDARTERHLWAETYDRELTDIFAIQSEVAVQIAAALHAELTADERVRIDRQPTADLGAYQLYLQGRHHLIRFTETGLTRAVDYFERAIGRDASYAPAYSGLAYALMELGETGLVPADDVYPRAREAAMQALALDGELGDAHCNVAHGKLVYEFDWAGAEAEFKRALELSPSNADACDLYGRLCSALGRHDEAIALLQRAYELDPLAHRVDIATAFLRAERYDEALAMATRAVEFDGEDARALSTLGWARLGLGLHEQGLAALERAVELTPGNTQWLGQLGQAYALHGKIERAREIRARLTEQSQLRHVAPYHLAYVYAGLGEYDPAMDCLEQAFEQRTGAVYGIKGSFLFKSLRSHPRFQALLQRMKLA